MIWAPHSRHISSLELRIFLELFVSSMATLMLLCVNFQLFPLQKCIFNKIKILSTFHQKEKQLPTFFSRFFFASQFKKVKAEENWVISRFRIFVKYYLVTLTTNQIAPFTLVESHWFSHQSTLALTRDNTTKSHGLTQNPPPYWLGQI